MPGHSIGIGTGMNPKYSGELTFLEQLFQDFGFINMWSSENITINGTTTTLHDYGKEHDLVNSSASLQPTYNAIGSIGSEGKPSLTFDGTDELSKSTTWRDTDQTGEVHMVFKINGGININALASYNPGVRNDFSQSIGAGTLFQMILDDQDNPPRTYGNGTSNIVTGSPDVVYAFGCRTGDYYMYYDSNFEAFSGFAIGSDNGACWLGDIAGRNKISVGNAAQIELCFIGYRDYSSLGDVVSIQNLLKPYYGT